MYMNCQNRSWPRAIALVLAAWTVAVRSQVDQCDSASQVAEYFLDVTNTCEAQPQCDCGMNDDGATYYAECSDTKQQCMAFDASVCGTQSYKIDYTVNYDTNPPSAVSHRGTYEWTYTRGRTETLTYSTSFMLDGSNECDFAIRDGTQDPTQCSCQLVKCDDGDVQYKIDCSVYEDGAIADGCKFDWGIPEGSVLEGLMVTLSGQCEAAANAAMAVKRESIIMVVVVVGVVALVALLLALILYRRRRREAKSREVKAKSIVDEGSENTEKSEPATTFKKIAQKDDDSAERVTTRVFVDANDGVVKEQTFERSPP